MSRVINKIFLVLALIISFNMKALAESIECNYPEANLTIKYDENNNISYNSNFINSEYMFNALLFKTGSQTVETTQLELDQDLWKTYTGNGVCPSGMKVCTVTRSSINVPTLKGLGASVADSFVSNLLTITHISEETREMLGEEAYALIKFNDRKLYILTDLEYNNTLGKYKDGVTITSTGMEHYQEGYNTCGGNEWWQQILGALCGTGWTALATVGDFFAGDITIREFIDKSCIKVSYDGPYASVNINCSQLINKTLQHKQAIDNYKSCNDDATCKSAALSLIKKVEDNIKLQCSSILQNYNFAGGQKECITDCLKIKDTLNANKRGTDLYDNGTGVNGQCGFSDRLIAWIINIIKWIKYIIPVIVIILGIIDFIKAIASDKDDEMKKAQGRFIKRLIAAALIFIVPFILEFILDKMGFSSNGCGIIDLG